MKVMTRNDYLELAAALKSARPNKAAGDRSTDNYVGWLDAVNAVADMLEAKSRKGIDKRTITENRGGMRGGFDKALFLRNCGVEPS